MTSLKNCNPQRRRQQQLSLHPKKLKGENENSLLTAVNLIRIRNQNVQKITLLIGYLPLETKICDIIVSITILKHVERLHCLKKIRGKYLQKMLSTLRVISNSYFNEGKLLLKSSKGRIVVIHVIFFWRPGNKMSNLNWIEHFYSLAMTVRTVVPKAWKIFAGKVIFVQEIPTIPDNSYLFEKKFVDITMECYSYR